MKGVNILDCVFFKPDKTFIKWLVEYANGRIIIEVGCGAANTVIDLADAGAKVFGIEPNWTIEQNVALVKSRIEQEKNIINISPSYVQHNESLLKQIANKALIIICRPSHGNFVEDTIRIKHPDTEVLYITIPENWTLYNDLGAYRAKAVQIPHTGTSAENELVWSIK